jgi:hypothetical protein
MKMEKLSLIAEHNLNFEIEDYSKFIIGKIENGQIVLLKDGFFNYIGLINPQDENYLFFATEFPYNNFSKKIQDQIDSIFLKYDYKIV